MVSLLCEHNFKVNDYLHEHESGYRVVHLLGNFNNVTADDLPTIQLLLECRIKAYNLALTNSHYKKAVAIVEPSQRIKLIMELAENALIGIELSCFLARQAWQFQVNIHSERELWELFFKIIGRYSIELMDMSERAHLRNLPDNIDIFRGYDKRYGRSGLSWTMSKLVASNYSKTRGNHIIAHSRVKKSDIVGYMNSKGQYEIIIPSMDCLENFRAINVINNRKYDRWQGLGDNA